MAAVSLQAWWVLVGLAAGLGIWATVLAVPQFGQRPLVDRIAPHVQDVSVHARLHAERRARTRLRARAPKTARLLRLGAESDASLARLLSQADMSTTTERYRAAQLVLASVGVVVGLLLALLLASTRPLPPLVSAVIVAVVPALAVAGRHWLLQRRVRRRLIASRADLPQVLEFLTLSLSAGESVIAAVRRLTKVAEGVLVREFAVASAAVGAGVPLVTALRELAERLPLPELERLVDQLHAGLDHGTPIVEVLRAHADDCREGEKRRLLEAAGRNEIAMLVPVVFLILPVTVLFAVFPGVVVLGAVW